MNNTQTGKITKINKDLYTVNISTSVLSCYVRGKLKERLVVGDSVIVDIENSMIEKLNPRKNKLIRPLVSNIDKLFIVVSTQIPAFSEYLLDKMLTLSIYNKITPIIIVTKLDICPKVEKKKILKILKYYKKYYTVYTNKQIRQIKREIKNNTVALCGQTGAGKSTLLNKINKNLQLKTGEISRALGRGKHTTRLVELIETSKGYIIDTPGFSSLELDLKKEDIRYTFPDFDNCCKYNSCLHTNNQGCKVLEDLKQNKILKTRYDNYIKLMNEVKK